MEDDWKIDKHINLAMVGAVLLQTAILVWGASNLWTRVGVIEESVKNSTSQGEKIAVIQEKVSTLQANVTQLEGWLRRNIPTRSP
jgi:hypothetical protein